VVTSLRTVASDVPRYIGHNIRRAVDEVTAANGVTNQVTHMVYSHHHCHHQGAVSAYLDAVRGPSGPVHP
jgi:hypothetical protein